MTATITIPKPGKRGTVTATLVEKHQAVFHPKTGVMQEFNVEREEAIQLMGLSAITGIDPLFIGDPGVGKTWMIELLLMLIRDATPEDFYNTLIFKETPADDVLGLRSLTAMKAGRIERLMDGYLPTAVIAYLDEVFKGSPTLLNAFLDIMANRKVKVGKDIISVAQLLCIFGSSNELPDREDLGPFRDRWGLTYWVKGVQTPEGRKRVMDIQDEFQAEGRRLDLSDAPSLSLDELATMKQEVSRVIVPDSVKESLNEAMDRFAQAGHEPSARRQGQMLMAIKGWAWMKGQGEARTEDMLPLQHMGWNMPDHAKSAQDIIMDFANAFTKKAAKLRDALEPITTELADIKSEMSANGGEPTDEQMQRSFEVMRSLRALRKDAKNEISDGERQGQDVSGLTDVLGEINRAHTWVEQTMVGEDDDE